LRARVCNANGKLLPPWTPLDKDQQWPELAVTHGSESGNYSRSPTKPRGMKLNLIILVSEPSRSLTILPVAFHSIVFHFRLPTQLSAFFYGTCQILDSHFRLPRTVCLIPLPVHGVFLLNNKLWNCAKTIIYVTLIHSWVPMTTSLRFFWGCLQSSHSWSGAWLFCRCGFPPGCSVLSLPGSLKQLALPRVPLSYHLVPFHVSCPSSVYPPTR
jgi:hypothetical protein